MAKQGMKRPDYTHTHPKNDIPPVPEIQGKAKHGNAHVNPIISGTKSPAQKVFHTKPFNISSEKNERPISSAYPVVDNDLARDNMENNIPYADLQDL